MDAQSPLIPRRPGPAGTNPTRTESRKRFDASGFFHAHLDTLFPVLTNILEIKLRTTQYYQLRTGQYQHNRNLERNNAPSRSP